jgi:hypothetical protein
MGLGSKAGGGLASTSQRTPLFRATSTGTLTGTKPAKVKVTVKSPEIGTVSVQGVRQAWPSEVRASAPGGSESSRRALPLTAEVSRRGIQDVSKLGDQDEQLLTSSALVSAAVAESAGRLRFPRGSDPSCR